MKQVALFIAITFLLLSFTSCALIDKPIITSSSPPQTSTKLPTPTTEASPVSSSLPTTLPSVAPPPTFPAPSSIPIESKTLIYSDTPWKISLNSVVREGTKVSIDISVTNNGTHPRGSFPYVLVVRDNGGQVFQPGDFNATPEQRGIVFFSGYLYPGDTKRRTLIFNVFPKSESLIMQAASTQDLKLINIFTINPVN